MNNNQRIQQTYERLFLAWRKGKATGYSKAARVRYSFRLSLATCETIAAGVRAERDGDGEPEIAALYRRICSEA